MVDLRHSLGALPRQAAWQRARPALVATLAWIAMSAAMAANQGRRADAATVPSGPPSANNSSSAILEDGDSLDLEEIETPAAPPSAEESKRLEALLTAPRPEQRSARKRLYESQVVAVRRLQWAPERAEAFFRSWDGAIQGDPRPTWELARQLMQGNDRDAAYAAAERAISLAHRAHHRMHYRAQFAMEVAADGDFDRAKALLAQAETVSARELDGDGGGLRDRWMQLRARNRVRAAHCTLDVDLMRHTSAVDACRGAAATAGELARDNSALTPRDLWSAQSEHLTRQLELVQALITAGRLFEADSAWQQAGRIADGYGRPRGVAWMLRGAQLRERQRRLDDAVDGARSALDASRRLGRSGTSVEQVDAWRIIVTARVLQGRWSEAQAAIEEIDRALVGHAAAAGRAEMLVARTLVALHFGRAATLEQRLRQTLAALSHRAGDESFITAHYRALLALALLARNEAGGMPAASSASVEGRDALRRALPVLLAPPSVGDDGDEQGLWAQVRQAALRRFLDDLGTAPSEAEASLGLQVADHMHGSLVQTALTQAAARGAAKSPALAEIVRRDQDARNELQTILQFIGRLTAFDAPRRLDTILSQMKRRIGELERQRARLHAEIARGFPEYDQLVRPRSPSSAEIAQLLASDEVFIALLPTETHVHVWAVSGAGTRYHRAAMGEADVGRLVQRMRATLDVVDQGPRMPAFDTEAALTMYRALLAPLGEPATGTHHLIVAASGVLGQLPLAVLTTGETSGDGMTPWLLRRTAVSHVASANAWSTLRRVPPRRPAVEALAGWGDPQFATGSASPPAIQNSGRARNLALRDSFDYGRIPPLPDTRDELLAIADNLQADRGRDLYLGAQATRGSVLRANDSGWLGRKRVVVFATHGLVPGDLPDLTQPALALANDGSGDTDPLAPLLTLEDVLSLKLQADWVVLSACNTAAGDGSSQEALSGLARGFFYAGSRSLLVTHWAVDSESAAQLTARTFAHQRTHPGARKAESLRQAELALMAQKAWAHPSFWAPYALVGDGGP